SGGTLQSGPAASDAQAALSGTFSGRQQLAATSATGATPASASANPGFSQGTAPPPSTPNITSPAIASSGTGGSAGSILPGIRIQADAINNSLLIYANQEQYRVIERALQQLDRPQLQVAIEATIAEVVLNNNLNYGVQFFLKSSDIGAGANNGSISLTTLATSAALQRVLPGFNFLAGSQADPRLIIDAIQSVTDVKILSNPSLVVMDNHVATLQVGDQIPVATRTAVSVEVPTAPVVNNIDYRNTGIILRVVPRINTNGNVLLDIEQEISNVASTSSADTLTPTVSQRRVKSS